MANTPFKKRFRYFFDNTMSKGPIALIIWLAILSLVLIIVAAAVLSITGFTQDESEGLNFIEAAWQSLMRTLDSGTMGGDTGWGFRLVMLFVTLGGIFVVSALIGVLSSGLDSKLEELRKGKSEVLEQDFTLILGWSSKIFTIISELTIANENQKKPRIVIIANRDKVEMEDELNANIESTKNTKVICRSGDVTNPIDLNMIDPTNAKAIIILGNEDSNSDFEIIKTILALTHSADKTKKPLHIVAEMKDVNNADVAKMVVKEEVEIILTNDIVSKIMVQTSRQSGLSVVYTELMDFDGDEIYFTHEKLLVGKTYAEAIFAYSSCTVIGLEQEGKVQINPPMNTLIQEGNRIICIAEDDDTLVIDKNISSWVSSEEVIISVDDEIIQDTIITDEEMYVPSFVHPLVKEEIIITKKIPQTKKIEKILLLGWNAIGIKIVGEINKYVAPGSKLVVIANIESPKELESINTRAFSNLQIQFIKADTCSRKVLEETKVFEYDYITLLSYALGDIQKSDSLTLITLLHLRDMMEKAQKNLNIVSEMLDLKNRELAEITNADDFIVSDKLLSLLITQVSENKQLMRVFDDVLNEEGSEIYMKPIENYINIHTPVNFYTLLESAKRKGETAIGYRIMALERDATQAYGIKLNPSKKDSIQFSSNDKIIVFAED